MECKLGPAAPDHAVVVVLIETLWNVNFLQPLLKDQLFFCINRNIVECKLPYATLQAKIKFVLIETLWNVNSTACREDTAAPERINRNIVECKFAGFLSRFCALLSY